MENSGLGNNSIKTGVITREITQEKHEIRYRRNKSKDRNRKRTITRKDITKNPCKEKKKGKGQEKVQGQEK